VQAVGDEVPTPVDLPPFVDEVWLQERADELLLADVRWSLDGSESFDTYLEGHLPGAIYVDLDSVLADAPSPSCGRHPLPSPEAFARGLGVAGIAEDEVVVAYDEGPGVIAARLAWMLRTIGQPAAVLDGGLGAWTGEIEDGEVSRPPVRRAPRPWPSERLADAELTARLSRSPDAVVLDARDPERYRGDVEPIDPRAGHIPGAISLPFAHNLDADGRLRPTDELRVRFAETGVLDAVEVVAYCGSGVTACHDLLVLEHVDGRSGRLYSGSWSAWSSDPERAVATGPDPG